MYVVGKIVHCIHLGRTHTALSIFLYFDFQVNSFKIGHFFHTNEIT